MTKKFRARVLAFVILHSSFLPLSVSAAPTLDELLELQPPATSPAQPDKTATVPINPDVADRLTGTEATDLFTQVVAQMDNAADRLGGNLGGQLGGKRDAGLETQRVQESVLAKLDRLILEAERQCQGGGKPKPKPQDQGGQCNSPPGSATATGQPTGTKANPGNPAGPGHAIDTQPGQPIEQHRREWGNLPPRIRAELLQGLGEPFSPVYRALTERYYRRLAEEAGE